MFSSTLRTCGIFCFVYMSGPHIVRRSQPHKLVLFKKCCRKYVLLSVSVPWIKSVSDQSNHLQHTRTPKITRTLNLTPTQPIGPTVTRLVLNFRQWRMPMMNANDERVCLYSMADSLETDRPVTFWRKFGSRTGTVVEEIHESSNRPTQLDYLFEFQLRPWSLLLLHSMIWIAGFAARSRDRPYVFQFRFRLYASYKPTPVPRKSTFRYNSVFNFIPVSFSFFCYF